MNVTSLLKTPRADAPRAGALTLLRLEASVLAQALLGSARESVLAFRFMRSVLLHGRPFVPPAPVPPSRAPERRVLA
jgi:hypothetical protein